MPRVSLLTLALALAPLLMAGDHPGVVKDAARGGPRPGKRCRIPEGAIKVPLHTVEQPDDYSCGAAALMSIYSHYGVGPRDVEALKKVLRTDPEQGTRFREIIASAKLLNLEVRWKSGMSVDELDEHLSRGRPVICAIQAYADDPATYDDPRSNRDGHYVVAIGFDRNHYFFMDPSNGRRRGFLPRAEFVRRWHDNEGTESHPQVIDHLGIVIEPEPEGTPFLRTARRID